MFAEVVIDSRTRVLDKCYTYRTDILVEPGDLVQIPFGRGDKDHYGFVLSTQERLDDDVDEGKIKEISSLLRKEAFRPESIPVIEFLRRNYLSSYIEAIKLFTQKGDLAKGHHKLRKVLYPVKIPEKREDWIKIYKYLEKNIEGGGVIKAEAVRDGYSLSSINTMIKKGYLEIREETDLRIDDRVFKRYEEKKFTKEQAEAFNTINEGEGGTYLLHGVTGSGKTEVFLRLVGEGVKKGEDSVILVPEIALTPQLVERVKGRFGKDISIFHSGLNEGERYDEWMRVYKGEVKIAVGARSALFLPFKKLKTIVIDEEHESSYKSDVNPKYITRDVAEFMAKENRGKLILCSATPSLESYKKALDGEYTLVKMLNRPGGGKLPEVSIVDLREELRAGNRSILSRELKEKIKESLDKKEQIILFLNRRGMTGFVSCRSCGFVYKCKNCSVSLTKHKGKRLICHHCGHMEFQKDRCPNCGSSYIKEFGIGTQKVEEEVKLIFPKAKVIRMDRDTTGKKDSYEKIYRTFKEGKADILIGTQMVAKGLDFSKVSLVGIISADTSLNLPDFRSYEKTFQLLTQVSGRAGRDKEGGRVVIQTYEPNVYPVVNSSNNDYESFYKKEIGVRKLYSYPPFGKLFSIVISSKDLGKLEEKLLEISKKIDQLNLNSSLFTKLGPVPCLLSRLKEYYRYQIILKGDIKEELARSIKDMLVENLKDGEYRLSIDANPDMLI